MLLFRASAEALRSEAQSDRLARHLAEQYSFALGRRPSQSEVRSWERSLPVLAEDLRDAGLMDVEVLVEYQLPLSSKRVDALVAGVHPRTGRPSYVLIELKQWSQAEAHDDADDLCYVESYGRHPVLHPAEQVRRYCSFLSDFARALEHETDAIAGAAYLHNATEFGIPSLRSPTASPNATSSKAPLGRTTSCTSPIPRSTTTRKHKPVSAPTSTSHVSASSRGGSPLNLLGLQVDIQLSRKSGAFVSANQLH